MREIIELPQESGRAIEVPASRHRGAVCPGCAGRSLARRQRVNQALYDELLALQRRDMNTRSLLLAEGRLYGDYAAGMQQVHRENALRLDEITGKYGWPGISLVGAEGGRAAWLVAQHSICTPDLQRGFLALLTRAAESGEAPVKQMALLTDRIRFHEGKPQVYGTVLDWNEEGELDCKVEDPATLDSRRKAAGLSPFREDLEARRNEARAEGARPPADFGQYQKRARAWAESVGW